MTSTVRRLPAPVGGSRQRRTDRRDVGGRDTRCLAGRAHPARALPAPFNDSAARTLCRATQVGRACQRRPANGVRLPVLAVPREVFLTTARQRPNISTVKPATSWLYGITAAAAAPEAGQPTVRSVEVIMVDDGDLDAMATENLGRQDLSELAEASLFAHYPIWGSPARHRRPPRRQPSDRVASALLLLLSQSELRGSRHGFGVLLQRRGLRNRGETAPTVPLFGRRPKTTTRTPTPRRGEQIHAMTPDQRPRAGFGGAGRPSGFAAERHAQGRRLGHTLVVDNLGSARRGLPRAPDERLRPGRGMGH